MSDLLIKGKSEPFHATAFSPSPNESDHLWFLEIGRTEFIDGIRAMILN
jgi:hypothetical protein